MKVLQAFKYRFQRKRKKTEIVAFADNERMAYEMYQYALMNPVKIPA